MRSDITPWTIRGMGLALGAAIVFGLVQLGIAAGGVLLLLFLSILLASALEPMVGTLRDRLPIGRGGTILLVYLSFFVLVLGLAFIVVPPRSSRPRRSSPRCPRSSTRPRAWAGDLSPTALSRSVTALIDSVAGILRPPPPPDPDTVVEVGAVVAEVAVSLATLLTIVSSGSSNTRGYSATCWPSCPPSVAPARATPGTGSRRGWVCGSAASSS